MYASSEGMAEPEEGEVAKLTAVFVRRLRAGENQKNIA